MMRKEKKWFLMASLFSHHFSHILNAVLFVNKFITINYQMFPVFPKNTFIRYIAVGKNGFKDSCQ